MLGAYLGLFASAEVFIYVFMEIVTKIETIQRVIFKKAEHCAIMPHLLPFLAYFRYSEPM